MNGTKIITDLNDLPDAIFGELNKYSIEVVNAVKNESKESASKLSKKIKTNASGFGRGKYSSSWRYKKTGEDNTSIEYTVYSAKPHYRVAHLLEYGYDHWKSGKHVSVHEHINPAFQDIQREFVRNVERRLKG